MKAVLISIKPKYCELIASGKKTIEIRKTRPKLATPFKVYIYETKGYDTLFGKDKPKKLCVSGGRVIGEFVCDDIAKVLNNICVFSIEGKSVAENNIIAHDSCLDFVDMKKYLGGKDGYAWHISNLVIYDKPKLLHHFFKPCDGCDKIGTKRCTEELTDCRAKVITRPPQSWCYVESEVAE